MSFTLLRQRNFALVWWAGLISITGDWMLRIALPVYVLQLTGSPLATSGAVMAGVLPSILFGLIAGVYVDRWDRRRTMLVVSVLQGLFLLPLLAGNVWAVYAVAFVQASLSLFFQPAEGSLLPQLVAAEDLTAANSLNSLNNNIGRLIGPVLGGFGLAGLGITGVVIIDMASFAVAAALLAAIAGDFRAKKLGESLGMRGELAEGFYAIRRSRVTTAIMVIVLLMSVGEGVMASLFPVLVTGPLNAGAVGLGSLMAAQAVGGLLGGLVGTRFAAKINPITMVTAGLAVFGVLDVLIFNYPRWSTVLWPELVLFALVGIPAVLSQAALMTLLQTAHPGEVLGRIFSVALMLGALATFAGASIAGTLALKAGVINVLTVQGTVQIFAALLFWLIARSGPARQLAPEPS